MERLDILLPLLLVVGAGIVLEVLAILGWASLVGMLGGPEHARRLARLFPGLGD